MVGGIRQHCRALPEKEAQVRGLGKHEKEQAGAADNQRKGCEGSQRHHDHSRTD